MQVFPINSVLPWSHWDNSGEDSRTDGNRTQRRRPRVDCWGCWPSCRSQSDCFISLSFFLVRSFTPLFVEPCHHLWWWCRHGGRCGCCCPTGWGIKGKSIFDILIPTRLGNMLKICAFGAKICCNRYVNIYGWKMGKGQKFYKLFLKKTSIWIRLVKNWP